MGQPFLKVRPRLYAVIWTTKCWILTDVSLRKSMLLCMPMKALENEESVLNRVSYINGEEQRQVMVSDFGSVQEIDIPQGFWCKI